MTLLIIIGLDGKQGTGSFVFPVFVSTDVFDAGPGDYIINFAVTSVFGVSLLVHCFQDHWLTNGWKG